MTPDRPLGKLIPEDQRSAPLVAIDACHAHVRFFVSRARVGGPAERGPDKLRFVKRSAIMTHAVCGGSEY
jgi:hypothetical protein